MRDRRPENPRLPKALLAALLVGMSAAGTMIAGAQAAAPAASSRVAGTVSAIAGSVLTVKDDKGVESKVTVPDAARVLELPAGSKSLSAATAIKIQDIAVGDRILAKTNPDGTASTVIAMKQADVAQKQQHDREDWRARGINGVVKSVDPAAQTVTVATGSGAAGKTVVVQASKATTVRRYAPDSTRFDDAKPSTLDQVKPGDQLRARGDKSADGAQLTAEDIVAGTFRNIAGTVLSVDPAASTLTVNDLATKKPFIVNINADSQLHTLPPAMAQGIARRLGGGAASSNSAGGGTAGRSDASSHAPGATSPPAPPNTAAETNGASGTPGQRGGDLQQMLSHAPVLQLADLKKGEAVMVLTTEGQAPGAATAITLLSGVEPLLQASPNSSQSVLSASWSVGGGAPAGDTQ